MNNSTDKKGIEGWEKQIQEACSNAECAGYTDFVIDAVRSLLSTQREELLREIEEALPNETNELKIAEEAKKEGVPKEKIMEIFTYWQGFNRALQQIKSLLSKLQRE